MIYEIRWLNSWGGKLEQLDLLAQQIGRENVPPLRDAPDFGADLSIIRRVWWDLRDSDRAYISTGMGAVPGPIPPLRWFEYMDRLYDTLSESEKRVYVRILQRVDREYLAMMKEERDAGIN